MQIIAPSAYISINDSWQIKLEDDFRIRNSVCPIKFNLFDGSK